MKCILLVRVSTEKQSFDEQEKELFNLAKSDGYLDDDIIAVSYKESAIKLKEEERAGLNQMKQLIENGDINRVYAWEISRIARKKNILFNVLDYLTTKKIQLTIKEPKLNLLTVDGEVDDNAETMFTLYAQLSESEMRNKKARFARAKKEAYSQGRYMGGKIKRGYRVTQDGYWAIDEEDSKLIKLIFNLYLSGEFSISALAKELHSRGHLTHLSEKNTKSEISFILRDPSYIGQNTRSNRFPPLLDMETWNKCVEQRKMNLHIHKSPNIYLLNKIIRCKCGYGYVVNLTDGLYICRMKHDGHTDAKEHSPGINASLVESIAWYIALTEFHTEKTTNRDKLNIQFQEEIDLLQQKITVSDEKIKTILEKRSELDERYYVGASITKELYEKLTKKQDEQITKEREVVRQFKGKISALEEQILNEQTFDELVGTIVDSFDSLKGGTDINVMKNITQRYIRTLSIERIEGNSAYWRKLTFTTTHSEEKAKKKKELEALGLNDAAILLSETIIVDTYHRKAYYDENCKFEVPFVFIDRLHKTRPERRTGRKRKKKSEDPK